MTSGDDRPPNGAFQTTSLPLGSNVSGRFFSSECPFCAGPRQWIQSPACAGERQRAKVRRKKDGPKSSRGTERTAWPGMCVSSRGGVPFDFVLLTFPLPHDAAGLHL